MLKIAGLWKSFGGLRRHARRLVRAESGRSACRHRPQRRRQDDILQPHHRPSQARQGGVSFEGRDLVGQAPQKIVRMGIARSFQRINIYPRLSVFENVQVALIAHAGQQWNLFRPGARCIARARASSPELVGLASESPEETGGELSYGKQKQLELAIALASQPRCCCSTSRPPACRRRRPARRSPRCAIS